MAATKPQLLTWATDATYSSGPVGVIGTPTRTTPTSGEQSSGFLPDDECDAQTVNSLYGLLWDWIGYLDAGELATDLIVDGSLTVGGQSMAFTAKTFVADSTTDQLAITSHGLATGDGPFRLTTTNTLPGGLALVTDYWAIFVDSGHIQLASSFLDAVHGVAIDITTTGTGTHTINPNSPTHATDATVSRNVIVDGDLTVAGRVTIPGLSPAQITIIGAAGIEQVPDNTKVNRVGPQLRFLATRTGSNGILYPIVLPVGTTLSTMKIVYNRAGNGLAFSIVAQDLDTGAATSGAQVLVNDTTSSGVQAPTVNLFAVDGSGHPTGAAGTLTVRADRAYWVLAECTFTSGVPIVYGLSINA